MRSDDLKREKLLREVGDINACLERLNRSDKARCTCGTHDQRPISELSELELRHMEDGNR